MDTPQEFPNTDKYKLGVDIDLKALALRHHFAAAVNGVRSHELTRDMLRQVTRQPDLEVLFQIDNDGSSYAYYPYLDTIGISETSLSLHLSMNVTKNNLPPIIPKEYTAELERHLFSLHEAEHRTQYVIIRDSDTGKVDTNASYPLIGSKYFSQQSMSDTADRMIKEADADLPVLEHLHEMGMPHIAQFWLDTRTIKATISHFPIMGNNKPSLHDVSAVTEHFRATGKVLDPITVLIDKRELLNQVRAEMRGKPMDLQEADNIMDDVVKILSSYGLKVNEMLSGPKKLDKDLLTEIMVPRPQIIMTAMQKVLERGNLSDFQKQEGERFMDAALRFGYTPEDRTYFDQVRDVIEKRLGLKPINPEQAQNIIITTSPPESSNKPVSPISQQKLQ